MLEQIANKKETKKSVIPSSTKLLSQIFQTLEFWYLEFHIPIGFLEKYGIKIQKKTLKNKNCTYAREPGVD